MIEKLKGIDILPYLDSSFFDSFRADYPQFNEWFKSKCLDRECLVVRQDNEIKAILIWKHGNFGTKICSLKILKNVGHLSSEFLDLLPQKSESIYFTVFAHHVNIISMANRKGFKKLQTLSKLGEFIFRKEDTK